MKNVFIDTTATREFFLSSDSEKSVTWILRALDSRLVLSILGRFHASDASPEEGVFARLVDFVRFGLAGARGLTDPEGKPIEVPIETVEVPYVGPRPVVPEDFLKKLRPEILIELGREIRDDNILTDDERKKSSGL